MELVKAIEAVTATKEGVVLFRHLLSVCGYNSNSVVENKITGEANAYATMYNEGRRDVYVVLRKDIPLEALIEIELKKPKPLKIKERPNKDGRNSNDNSGGNVSGDND